MDKTHFTDFSLKVPRLGGFLRILRFLLHLKQLSCKTNLHERSENLPFSRNLVRTEKKRRAQGGAMWTEDNKKSDANHMAWINLIQSNSAHCAKRGLVRVENSYIDAASAQVFAPGLFGGFSFRGLKRLKGGDSWKNTVERNSKRENSESEYEESRFFTGANLVLLPA